MASISTLVSFREPQPGAGPPLTLLCLSFAGGTPGAFRELALGVPAGLEVAAVQYPGRWGSPGPCYDRMEPLVDSLATALEPGLPGRYALLGYSMGALVAYELARELRRRRAPSPEHLFVLSQRAPHAPARFGPMHALPSEDLLAAMEARYDGLPDEVRREPALLDYVLPMMRADMAVCETFTPAAEPPLATNLTAFRGIHDRALLAGAVSEWSRCVSGRFTQHDLDAGHFVLAERFDEVAGAIAAAVAR